MQYEGLYLLVIFNKTKCKLVIDEVLIKVKFFSAKMTFMCSGSHLKRQASPWQVDAGLCKRRLNTLYDRETLILLPPWLGDTWVFG